MNKYIIIVVLIVIILFLTFKKREHYTNDEALKNILSLYVTSNGTPKISELNINNNLNIDLSGIITIGDKESKPVWQISPNKDKTELAIYPYYENKNSNKQSRIKGLIIDTSGNVKVNGTLTVNGAVILNNKETEKPNTEDKYKKQSWMIYSADYPGYSRGLYFAPIKDISPTASDPYKLQNSTFMLMHTNDGNVDINGDPNQNQYDKYNTKNIINNITDV